MKINLPKLSLVILIGPSGSGKTTFARRHFLTSEILSSDFCRGVVSDDENDQAATADAFDVLRYIAAKRLERGKLTVVDATNVQRDARAPLVSLARQYHVLPVAIVLNLSEETCRDRNRDRPDRALGPHVIRQQRQQLRRSLGDLKREGFRYVFVLERADQIDAVQIEREPLWTDRTFEHGPFDIIGDVHGCADELVDLLSLLGYQKTPDVQCEPGWSPICYAHPAGRKAIFVGDLVDRGPRVIDSLSIARNMVVAGSALCVPGNHDIKLLKKLSGREVQISHGLAQTLTEIDALPDADREPFSQSARAFLDGLISHYVLDDGKLVVAHAGMKQSMQGRGSRTVRDFALYGETTGETDELGLPVRQNWTADYRGSAMVVYGHTPVAEPEWINHTVNIDTGCVFGGKLTALRYPEAEFVSVPSRRTYFESVRPFLKNDQRSNSLTLQQQQDDLLDAKDVMGKRFICTRLNQSITIREENATAALEVMSRFAADPKWLIYLPPTMSPCETSIQPGLLEHPAEAFAYYRNHGVPQVICEEKHMGSRAVVVVCQGPNAAQRRFGVTCGASGIAYTRTGRRLFNDVNLERQFLERVQTALTAADFWTAFKTDWVCLDCELMPWSAKAQELLRNQYAAVGAAASAALPKVVTALELATQRLSGESAALASEVHARFAGQQGRIQQFIATYRHYCWPVDSIEDLKLAPFHLLATEGRCHASQNHVWHLDELARICTADPQLMLATNSKIVDVTDGQSEEAGIEWWTQLTASGGEGMVVKPLDYIARGSKGLLQPAIKCRGPEYLRIIYGPEYSVDKNLTRLKQRGLGMKRSLALREFALGIEGLERFVRREPLRRVHECVFGVLALESEPVDPRL